MTTVLEDRWDWLPEDVGLLLLDYKASDLEGYYHVSRKHLRCIYDHGFNKGVQYRAKLDRMYGWGRRWEGLLFGIAIGSSLAISVL